MLYLKHGVTSGDFRRLCPIKGSFAVLRTLATVLMIDGVVFGVLTFFGPWKGRDEVGVKRRERIAEHVAWPSCEARTSAFLIFIFFHLCRMLMTTNGRDILSTEGGREAGWRVLCKGLNRLEYEYIPVCMHEVSEEG